VGRCRWWNCTSKIYYQKFNSTTTSSSYVDTGQEVTITPTSASNDIFIIANEYLKHKAIRNIYSTVVTVYETEDGVFTAKDKNGNEVSIDMTAVNTKATELENAEVNVKVSGNQKLLDLGLTQAEATALTGYTPPAEV
jgi:hypothetical protein